MKAAANASPEVSREEDEAHPATSRDADAANIGALLAALSTVLRDTLLRFESVSGRVSAHVLTRREIVDKDLIVALQDFDRLQQEFAAIGDLISYCAEWGGSGQAAHARAAIDIVALTDLKDRIRSCLAGHFVGFSSMPAAEEQVF